jgi:phosphatidylserine/phosphatidylglycerophosphate/cardiolipin synthase-like enzyme
VIRNAAFAAQMERMFEDDFAYSTPLGPATLDARGFWWRFGVSASRLFAPVL